MNQTEVNSITLEKSVSQILEPGILTNEFKEGAEIEADDIMAAKNSNLKLADGKRYAIMLSFGYLTNTSKEARELAANKDFSMNTIAIALLTESTGQRLMGNFYLSFHKPHVKTRLFNTKEAAMIWLRQRLDEQQVLEKDWAL